MSRRGGRGRGSSARARHAVRRATLSARARLLEARDESAATLRAEVTSPGGTTEAALRVLMAEPGLKALLAEAVAAAAARGRMLGGG